MAVAFLMAGTQATALTIREVDKTCPLCKTEFKARLAGSGTQFGMRLDLKPLGAIAAPWPVAVCPKCHFVLLGDDLSDPELAKLKAFVKTKEYQTWGEARSSHFLMGKLLSTLGRDDITLAHVYLKASWQEEGEKKFLTEDLQLSLKHFEAFLKAGPPNDKKNPDEGQEEDNAASSYQTAQLLKGELLRRLTRFDEAKAHLQTLLKQKPFQGTFFGNIVAYEIRLCGKKDAEPHEVSDAQTDGNSEQPPERDK
jgi:hypothetical protein